MPDLVSPTIQDIKRAATNILGKAIRTPLVRLNWQPENAGEVEIWLKLENLQPIGSFKARNTYVVPFLLHLPTGCVLPHLT